MNLLHITKELKENLFILVQEKGLFNPYWDKSFEEILDDDFGFDAEPGYRTIDPIVAKKAQSDAVLREFCLKKMEVERLLIKGESLPEFDRYANANAKRFASVDQKIMDEAEKEFTKKHPGFAKGNRISAFQLKICWQQEQ